MKLIVRTLLVLSMCSATNVEAATCRSGAAAIAGAKSGYNRDQQAAVTTATNDRSSSDILGKCVGGITSILTAPQFPSLSDIFDQIKNKVCAIASDQIDAQIGEVNSQISGAMTNINSQISSTGATSIIGTSATITSPTIQQTNPGTASSSQFWSDIWK